MCGIVGVFSARGASSRVRLEEALPGMLAQLHHRGPDGFGHFYSDRAALGHTRLAVIDLSSRANQPMASEDGKVHLVFNGEIYNHQALRAELEAEGMGFKTQSDTEVLLQAYRRWGIDLLSRLRGMFAFGLIDLTNDCIYLVRDRIGKKPLFFSRHNGHLLFASEPKAILAWPGFPRRPNLRAIHHYLSLQYIPAPWSAFDGIEKLPPASYARFDGQGRWSVTRYWHLPKPSLHRNRSISDSDVHEQLVTSLDEAVKIRLQSDVPLGAFLSGGVDSSAVVALMARSTGQRVKTFCIGFDEPDYDERNYARRVANLYATDHTERVVRPDALALLPNLVWHYNEPFADPSAIPTYYLSQVAREAVTVVLNGDGGDENFYGYGRYANCLAADQAFPLPRWLSKPLARAARRLPPVVESFRPMRVLRRFMAGLETTSAETYAAWMFYFSDYDKALGYGPAMQQYLFESTSTLLQPYFDAVPQSMAAGAAWADAHTYLPDDLLVKVDIATMAHGLEARSPFLDHEFMQWVAQLPAEMKIDKTTTKKVLKKALEPLLPREILYRKKMGFGVPIDEWIRGPLRSLMHDTLLSEAALARGIVDERYTRNMLREHESGVRMHHTRLWALLMLELWFNMWIDSPTLPTRPTPPKLN